nr:MAG TPA: nucelotide kinase [Caudoviricetes sp.]
MNTLDTQIGGTHYTDLPHQPLDLIAGLDLDFFQGNVVKYLTRYPYKGDPVSDLKKAADYCRKAHTFLYYRQLTDDYRKRATYGVEAHCEANGLPDKVAEAMLKAILCQWREASKLIHELLDCELLNSAAEEERYNSVGEGDFYTAADGDLVLGARYSDDGQYRITDERGQYAVIRTVRGHTILKGRYATIDEAKEGVIAHRESDIEERITHLTAELERSRAKHPIK